LGETAEGTVRKYDVGDLPSGNSGPPTDVIWVVLTGVGTDITTGATELPLYLPLGFEIDTTKENGVGCSLGVAPTGSAVTIDINEETNSILTTRITIDASTNTSKVAATAPVVSDTTLASGAKITWDIDIVGAATPGQQLVCWLIGAWQ
jgi:hypothetical protein